MNRRECLNAAADIVSGEREIAYGKPENSFFYIARLWSDLLNHPISEVDVALMMALVKIARLHSCNNHVDSWVDLAGYAACGCETVTGNNE